MPLLQSRACISAAPAATDALQRYQARPEPLRPTRRVGQHTVPSGRTAETVASEYIRSQEGVWDEATQTQTDTICPYWGVGCTLTLHVQHNQIVKVPSPLDHEVGCGHLCMKGRFGWQFV